MVEHGNCDLASSSEVYLHSEARVNLTATHCHRTGSVFEHALALLTQTLDHLLISFGHDMTHLQVIDVPADGHLFSIDHFVGHARIARVINETNTCRTLDELSIA
jgi:hypothetical protein